MEPISEVEWMVAEVKGPGKEGKTGERAQLKGGWF